MLIHSELMIFILIFFVEEEDIMTPILRSAKLEQSQRPVQDFKTSRLRIVVGPAGLTFWPSEHCSSTSRATPGNLACGEFETFSSSSILNCRAIVHHCASPCRASVVRLPWGSFDWPVFPFFFFDFIHHHLHPRSSSLRSPVNLPSMLAALPAIIDCWVCSASNAR